jgi:plasmid stabilization system protein ParE
LKLELHPAAEAEAREARLRYRASDPAVADRFMAALDRAMDHIADNPERWPLYLHETRRMLVRRFPFSIIYRVEAQRILVVAISHQRRRPGYWRRRQPKP